MFVNEANGHYILSFGFVEYAVLALRLKYVAAFGHESDTASKKTFVPSYESEILIQAKKGGEPTPP